MSDAPELLPPEGAEVGSQHWHIWSVTRRVSERPLEWHPGKAMWRDGDAWISAADAHLLGWRYHAPARPDDATERARLEGEVARLRGLAISLVDEIIKTGCPICNGDCSSANPPVMGCPTRQWLDMKEALRHDR